MEVWCQYKYNNKNSISMQQRESRQLTEDVGILAKIIKRSLCAFQMLTTQQELDAEYGVKINKIFEEARYLLQIARKYRNIDSFAHIQIFQRLRLKIRQWLTHIRGRYQLGAAFKSIRTFLQQIQVALAVFDKNLSFSQLTMKLYTIINEQLRSFKIKSQLLNQRQQSSLQKPQKIKLKRSLSMCIEQQGTTSNVPNDVLPSVNLTALYGIDLDNSFMRSTLISLRKNQFQWLQSQLERNRVICKQFQSFSQQYFLRMKRCKRQHYSQTKNIQNLRTKTAVHQKLFHNFHISKAKRTETKQNKEEQASKTLFKVSNIYVSGSEFDVFCEKSKLKIGNLSEGKKKGSLFLNRALRDPLTAKFSNCNSKQFSNL